MQKTETMFGAGRWSLVDSDGYVRRSWFTTAGNALQWAGRFAERGDTLVAPGGFTLARYGSWGAVTLLAVTA